LKVFGRVAAIIFSIGLSSTLPYAPAVSQPIQQGAQSFAQRDGQHDFDFELGTWKAHAMSLPHRLVGSNDWDEFNGTVVTRPIMDGKGNISEMNADTATGTKHIQIIAVRLYNPASHQWSIYGASAKQGTFDPPQVGQFQGKQGEFYATDTYEGRAILIRFVWTDLGANRTHMEQAFSADGGKNWEVNWKYDGTKMGESPKGDTPTAAMKKK
jgi:hypothetical protein